MGIRHPSLVNCPGCGAVAGEKDTDMECDWAQRPGCRQQFLSCRGRCDGYDGRPAIWHGVDQQITADRQPGWWTSAAGIGHLVQDATRVTITVALGMITRNRDRQAYVIGHAGEAALDAQLRANSQ